MLNDRLAAAKDVATHLFALEAAIDEALTCAGALTIALPAARKRAKISAVVGQDATQLAGETITALIAARAKIVEAHGVFADIRDEMGLKTYAGGDLWKLKENAQDKSAPLTLVQTA